MWLWVGKTVCLSLCALATARSIDDAAQTLEHNGRPTRGLGSVPGWAAGEAGQYHLATTTRGDWYVNYSVLDPVKGDFDNYRSLNRVGKGKFSVVYRGIHRRSREPVALKYLIMPVDQSRVYREIKVMSQLIGGPNIIQLLDYVHEPTTNVSVLVMNYVSQGMSYKDLFRNFSDWDIRFYMYEVFKALDFAHSHGIVHRDLKPLNIVYDPEKYHLDVCDWGTAEFYKPGERMKTKLGTKQYKSPELLLRKRDYDFKIDIWTAGVTMLSMVFQRYPFFKCQDDVDQFLNIVELKGMKAVQEFTDKYGLYFNRAQRQGIDEEDAEAFQGMPFDTFLDHDNFHLSSPPAWDLLSHLLTVDPETRYTAKEAMEHEYFTPIRECHLDIPQVNWPYEYVYEEEEAQE